MLSRLHIRNYAIISDLEVEFLSGLTILTGETGAGKSILLGALSLVLGKRADSSVLYNETAKCVVEAEFITDGFALQSFFEENDIDLESTTTIRREINAQGKSRAFINDTPVNLPQLKQLADCLVDLHSQHEVHTLKEPDFRARFLDACWDKGKSFADFSIVYDDWSQKKRVLSKLEKEANQLRSEEDYLRFQVQEFQELHLVKGELAEIVERLATLEHAGEINSTLSKVTNQLANGEQALIDALRQLGNDVARLSKNFSKAEDWAQRIKSSAIELEDVNDEMDRSLSTVEEDPKELERLQERVDAIYHLMNKHRKQNEDELFDFLGDLEAKLSGIERSDEELNKLQAEVNKLQVNLFSKAEALTQARKSIAIGLSEKLAKELHQLGMPDAVVQFSIQPNEMNALGADTIQVLFSANKGQPLQDISKVASGGELSRLMLVIKAEMARNTQLPTVIFDEIDTGVSGDVADKMGLKIRELSSFMQVICITHLPQIASKGMQHLFVYKEEDANRTITRIRVLNIEDRVMEIAKMLSNDSPTEAAISNARHLVGIAS